MGWLSLVCLALILCYSGYPKKVKVLESKVKKLERKNSELSRANSYAKNRSAEGDLEMSQIMNEIKGKNCNIVLQNTMENMFDNTLDGIVLDVDEEWIKIRCKVKDKKKGKTVEAVKIIRIDDIESIEYSE